MGISLPRHRHRDEESLQGGDRDENQEETEMKLKFLTAILIAGAALTSLQADAQEKKQLAFVVNASSDFWKLAEAGVKKAQGELGDGYELQFRYPAQGTAALQNALMDDLVAAGTDAIMISSADPKNSIDAFNRIAGQVPLFTTDSDAPQSNRIAYLGSSNTAAGVQAGEQMVAAMAGKEGKCMGFVGFLGADNAVERINGFKQAVEGHNITLVDVRGDDVDFARARSNVDDVLVANPEINCMVGFYSYNPPYIYQALKAADKLGKITVVGFDEDPVTLGAVKEGSFYSTVVQQPFEWGYQGMKLMAAYLNGDKSGVPADKLIIVPTAVINKDNVDAFQADLKAKIASAG
jgi:ribose transport system substrate-binding protein